MTNSKKIFCFDIDNTICKTNKNYYKSSNPIKKNIDIINQLFYSGHKIIIFTARFMGRNKNSIQAANKQGYEFTHSQLKKWGLKFHELHISKPAADLYVDDKALFFRRDWTKSLKKFVIKNKKIKK